jgi:hypothetical protein
MVTDPAPLLDRVDQELFNSMRAYPMQKDLESPKFVEPVPLADSVQSTTESLKLLHSSGDLPQIISGRVQRFGDNIDTDMVYIFILLLTIIDNSRGPMFQSGYYKGWLPLRQTNILRPRQKRCKCDRGGQCFRMWFIS